MAGSEIIVADSVEKLFLSIIECIIVIIVF